MDSDRGSDGSSRAAPPSQISARPAVDVVIPFRGSGRELRALLKQMSAVRLAAADTMTVVDNRLSDTRSERMWAPRRRVLGDGLVEGSYYARNRGAEGGAGEWVLFIDADVTAPADLLGRYFALPVEADTAVLAGGVCDEPVTAGHWRHPAARYAHVRGAMSQSNTLRAGPWAYAQTANCAVRRSAFDAIGGFTENVRSGGDADLCFRLARLGWRLEARADAEVSHRSRPSLHAMLRQLARHGSGAAWLNDRYPGSFPGRLSLGTVAWSARQLFGAARALTRADGRGDAVLLGIEVLSHWAFELGRMASNEIKVRPPAAV